MKKIFTIAVIVISALFPGSSVRAQDQMEEEITVVDTVPVYALTGAEKQLIAERIASWNTDWKKVELDGKLSVEGLPVRPTLKVFMESGKKLFISVRVPFLGEAARIEITSDEVIIINKIKQTYYKADPKELLEEHPTLISELQALLLGRIAIVGEGEFKASRADAVEIMQNTPDTFLVIPANIVAEGMLNFGYSVSTNGQLQDMIGVYAPFDGYLNLSYSRSGERLQIRGELVGGKSSHSATLQFDAPDWEGKGFSKMKINSNYRQVGFREILKLN